MLMTAFPPCPGRLGGLTPPLPHGRASGSTDESVCPTLVHEALRALWGGPPGPRTTPPSACRLLPRCWHRWSGCETRASRADRGVCPTKLPTDSLSAFPYGSIDFSGGAQCQNDSDRKSTRLNSSHLGISYAVFCLKKKT